MTYSPEELLPHAPPMVLLDRVLEWDDESILAELTIGPSTPFLDVGRGVPAHVGLEWMAQTCGLFAGLDQPPHGGQRPGHGEGDLLPLQAVERLGQGLGVDLDPQIDHRRDIPPPGRR